MAKVDSIIKMGMLEVGKPVQVYKSYAMLSQQKMFVVKNAWGRRVISAIDFRAQSNCYIIIAIFLSVELCQQCLASLP